MLFEAPAESLPLWSEEELIRDGSEVAKAEIWRRWQRWLQAVARGYYCGQPGGPDCFIDNVLAKTWNEFSRARLRANCAAACKSFLKRTIGFNALDERRHLRRFIEQPPEIEPSRTPSPLEAAQQALLEGDVESALAALPTRWARVLRFKYWEGMTSTEIARQEGTSPENIDTITYRAKRQLAPALLKWKTTACA